MGAFAAWFLRPCLFHKVSPLRHWSLPSFLLLGHGGVSWLQRSRSPLGSRAACGSLHTRRGDGQPTGSVGRVIPPKLTGDVAGMRGGGGLAPGCTAGLGTKPASDTFPGSRFIPDFNRVPLPYSPFGTQQVRADLPCSSSCQGDPGQEYWYNQSVAQKAQHALPHAPRSL